MRSRTTLWLLASHALRIQAKLDTCYYPDKTVSPDTPCNSSAEVSSCCNQNALCLSNGLCYQGVTSRGSCTDRSWGSDCPLYCRDDNPGGGYTISFCGPSDEWACGAAAEAASQCSNGNTFLLPKGAAILLRPEQVSDLGFDGGLELTATASLFSNLTATQNTTSNCSTPAPIIPSDKEYTAAEMAGVGLGVGVPLLLALLASMIFIAKLRKQHQYAPTPVLYPGYEAQGDLQSKKQDTTKQPQEMDASGMQREMDASGLRRELE